MKGRYKERFNIGLSGAAADLRDLTIMDKLDERPGVRYTHGRDYGVQEFEPIVPAEGQPKRRRQPQLGEGLSCRKKL